MNFKKYFPIAVFLLFLGSILGATLYYSPSWGLMDDQQSLCNVEKIWGTGFSLSNLWNIIKGHYAATGVFCPLYFIYAGITYYIFRGSPVSIYSLIIVFNMLTLLLWGMLLHDLFSRERDDKWVNIFIFPLSFFIFTPFWNIFMYISLQERFIYFFSALALYFLNIGYNKNKCYLTFIATLLLLLGILIKPTCIYLVLAFCIFAFLDVIFLNYKRSISFFVFIFNLFVFSAYYYFTVKSIRGYSLKYRENLNLGGIINSILAASIMVKLLLICACAVFIFMFLCILVKKNKFSPIGILIPLGLLCYMLVLSPWGFLPYHLSAAAPYVMGIFFPFFILLNRKSKIINYLNNALLIFLVTISLIFIIVPRISRMSDIKDVEYFIRKFNVGNADSVYFYPPPFCESAYALQSFTGARIVYFADATLSKNMLKGYDCNYLVFRDEYFPVTIKLKDVKIDKEIYHNNTWKINRLVRKDGYSGEFKIEFLQNFVAKIKNFLRDLK